MYFCSVETDNKTSESTRLTLSKSCKLRHRSLVDKLFSEGKTLYQYPIRLSFKALSDEELKCSFRHSVPDRIGPVQFLITVPKKKVRHAVDRVLMRRRIREAIRLRLPLLKDYVAARENVRTLSLAWIYLDKNITSSDHIGTKIDRLIDRLIHPSDNNSTPAIDRNEDNPEKTAD